MILTIPPSPSPSYFAPGVVIISTLLISSAGIICRAVAKSPVKNEEAFPFRRNFMFLDPLSSTFPSKSTDNKGAFLNTSVASSDAPLSSLSALYIILSSFDS